MPGQGREPSRANPPGEAAAVGRHPSFFIVGTPRSGTTLVQRLLTDLPGIQIPPETHFFSRFLWRHYTNDAFPMGLRQAQDLVRRYRSEQLVNVDERSWLARLPPDGIDAPQLFAGLLSTLAPEARHVGEKTPAHLHWTRDLLSAFPNSRVIIMMRDPRAVVRSLADVGWSDPDLDGRCERWRLDAEAIADLRDSVAADRMRVLRFETLVASPSETIQHLGGWLLGDMPEPAPVTSDQDLFLASESWKWRANHPPDPDRASAWRTELPRREQLRVSQICGDEMKVFGYEPNRGWRMTALARRLVTPLRERRRSSRRRELESRWRQSGVRFSGYGDRSP